MRPLRTDDDLLALAGRSGSAALARACRTGFYTTPLARKFPWGNHGWTFEVWNDRGSRWRIVIQVNEEERTYNVRTAKDS